MLCLLAGLPSHADPLPAGLGPCVPGACPDAFPPVNNGPFAGRDNAINVFVGGNFRVREAAAEAEGRVVAIGDFDMNKTAGSTVYNVGIAGLGSRVPPEDGQDFLAAGGDVTIASGQTLLADSGVVRHAGALSGMVSGLTIQDPNAVAAYGDIAQQLTAASACYVDRAEVPATGMVTFANGVFTFNGDNTSTLQVFYVEQDLAGPGGSSIGLSFLGIPDGATVLINVVASAEWTFNTFSGDLADQDPWNALRERMLWNIPLATVVNLVGVSHLQGSVLVGNSDSTTTMTKPGMAGRFFTAGDLIHAGDGSQFHAYPFDGVLPSCASPSPRPCPNPSPTPPSPPSSCLPFALPETGSDLIELPVLAVALIGAGAAILLALRRRRSFAVTPACRCAVP